jgi:hypothetical protein
MQIKGIRELLITDVVLVTGFFVLSDWQGKGKQYSCSSPHQAGIHEEGRYSSIHS